MLIWLLACQPGDIPPPEVTGVSPRTHTFGVATDLRIVGKNFIIKVTRRLNGETEFRTDDQFGVAIRNMDDDSLPISLDEIKYKNDKLILATIPDSVAPGHYTLRVTTPYGKSDDLESPVVINAVDGDSADSNDTDTIDTETETDTDVDSATDTGTEKTVDSASDSGVVKTDRSDVADFARNYIDVDGLLTEEDWDLSTPIENTLLGSPNDEVAFDLLWNYQYIYIAVQSTDDIGKNDSDQKWMDDSIDLVFDMNNSKGEAFDFSDDHCIKAYSDDGFYCKSGNTIGILHGSTSVAGSGWTVEVAIPWLHFGVIPSVGMVIGFDIGINDDDGENSDLDRDSQLRWNGDTDDWWTPLLYGKITLTNSIGL